jgi:AcrR family transcriptional regulator
MPARERNVRGRARRAELIAAAARLARSGGVRALTPARIAAAAGVSSSLFYWYFDSVDTLLREAATDTFAAVQDEVARAKAPFEHPLERIHAVVRSTIEQSENNDLVALLVELESERNASRNAPAMAQGDTIFLDVLHEVAQGQADGTVRGDIPAFHLACCIRSVIGDTVSRYVHGELKAKLADMATSCADFAVQGIADGTSGRNSA